MSDTIHKIDETGMSKDYERLYELAKKQSVICISGSIANRRELCRTSYNGYEDGREYIELGTRGVCYQLSRSKNEFMQNCESSNVSFVDPVDLILGDEHRTCKAAWDSIEKMESIDNEAK